MKMNKIFVLLTMFASMTITGCGCHPSDHPDDSSSPIQPIEKSITFSRTKASVLKGEQYQIEYTLKGFEESSDSLIVWTSSKPEFASVDNKGLVSGLEVGISTITATIEGYSTSMDISVLNDDETTNFTCIEKMTVYRNEILSFNESTKFRGKEVEAAYSYLSSNPDVVLVEEGLVQSIGLGEATVTITSTYREHVSSLQCQINVIPAVEVVVNTESVTLAPKTYTGSKFIKDIQLDAKAYVDNQEIETEFSWSSRDESIATVQNGLISSNEIGNTVVVCSIEYEGETYSKLIAVNVEFPKDYIDQEIIVNIGSDEKTLDLTPIGFNNDEVVSILDEGQIIEFEIKDGLIYLKNIDESYYHTTKSFEIIIGDETYIINVTFKEYVENKIYFADSPSHIGSLVPKGSAAVSYDPNMTLNHDSISEVDKQLFAKEGQGSTKIKLSGAKDEAIVLNRPEFNDVSEADYIVFYLYTNLTGYTGGTWWANDHALTPGKWNRVVISDFDKVTDSSGKYLKDKNYDIKDFVVRIFNYESPVKDGVVWLSSIYMGKIEEDYFVSKSDRQFGDYSETYAIEILRPNNGFTLNLNCGLPNAPVYGAVTVENGSRWVEVKANGLDKWYRKTKGSDDWWVKMGDWCAFSDTTDENGEITITTGIYAQEDAIPDSGPMSAGTIIYVAYKDSPTSDYAVSRSTTKTYEDYTVYQIDILKENEGFTTQINFGSANKEVVGAVTVENGTRWVEVKANGLDKWYRKNKRSSDWWELMGDWCTFSDTTDENGNISITTGIYAKEDAISDSGPMSVGTKIYIALKEKPGDVFELITPADKTYEDYTVYMAKVVISNSGFEFKINLGEAGKTINGAITVDGGSKWVEVLANGFDKWYRSTWSDGCWWELMGKWTAFTDTTDSEGNITIKTSIYKTNDVPDYGPMSVGTKIYVAIKTN